MGVACTVVVDALVVALFGLGWKTDAYFVATTVPLLLVWVLALHALQVVQPLFIHAPEEGEEAGWLVLNVIMTTSTVIVLILAATGALFSPLLIRVQLPGRDESSGTLATRLSWVFFLLLPSAVVSMRRPG